MTEKYCHRCGCKLDYTTMNAWWCPNCGKLVENQEKDDKNEEHLSYVG